MGFHRHCYAWVRVSSDEIANMCVHCHQLGSDDPKVLGEWFEWDGDDKRLAQSQAAFKAAHVGGCQQNGGAHLTRKAQAARAARRSRDDDWFWGA